MCLFDTNDGGERLAVYNSGENGFTTGHAGEEITVGNGCDAPVRGAPLNFGGNLFAAAEHTHPERFPDFQRCIEILRADSPDIQFLKICGTVVIRHAQILLGRHRYAARRGGTAIGGGDGDGGAARAHGGHGAVVRDGGRGGVAARPDAVFRARDGQLRAAALNERERLLVEREGDGRIRGGRGRRGDILNGGLVRLFKQRRDLVAEEGIDQKSRQEHDHDHEHRSADAGALLALDAAAVPGLAALGQLLILGAEGAFFITIGKQFPALGALEQLHKSIPP